MNYPFVLQPALQPRRRCGSVAGPQVAALMLQYMFVVVLVLLGVGAPLAAGIALVMFGVLRGVIPVPVTGASFWTAA